MENKKIDRCQSFFLTNNFIPKNIINNPTNKFKILETIVGINSERIVPNNATLVKNNKVEETNPIANKTNCLFVNFSSIIFVVKTLPQNTIVIGLDKVRINPCIKILDEVGVKFKLGIRLIPNTPNAILAPNNINMAAPTIEKTVLKVFFI